MTMKEELHRLVEELPEEKAAQAKHLLTLLHSEMTSEERVARVRSALGKFAHVQTSSEDFYRRKREDRIREEEQDERRQRGKG